MTISLPSFPAPSNACDVLGLLQTGKAFASSVTGSIASLKGQLGSVTALVGNLPNMLKGVEASVVSGLQAQLKGVLTGAVASLEAHVQNQISGLVSNLGMAVSHLAAQAGLAGTGGGCSLPSLAGIPAGNPCFNMGNLFGSITGAADKLVQGIASQLSGITSAINGITGAATAALGAVMGSINGALGAITGIAGQITTMIGAEVAAISAMVGELLNFANVSSLFGLSNNACAKQVLSAVGSPALKSALGV